MIYRFSVSGVIQSNEKICQIVGDLRESLNIAADIQSMKVRIVIPKSSKSKGKNQKRESART